MRLFLKVKHPDPALVPTAVEAKLPQNILAINICFSVSSLEIDYATFYSMLPLTFGYYRKEKCIKPWMFRLKKACPV